VYLRRHGPIGSRDGEGNDCRRQCHVTVSSIRWTYPFLSSAGILKSHFPSFITLLDAHSPLNRMLSEILNHGAVMASTPSQPATKSDSLIPKHRISMLTIGAGCHVFDYGAWIGQHLKHVKKHRAGVVAHLRVPMARNRLQDHWPYDSTESLR